MNQDGIFQVLLAPHVSEKTAITSNGYMQYAFKVVPQSNKKQIKVAVEKLFNVTVRAVTIVNVKSKQVRFGRTQGRHKAWKKAYVTLAAGHEIDVTA